MGNAIRWGVILAVCVTAVNVLMIVAGLHTNPFVGGFGALGIYILLNAGVVVLCLQQTRQRNGYGAQVLQAATLGLVGGIAIFALSYLVMTAVFPSALEETKAGFLEMVETAGLPEAQVEAQRAQFEAMTPFGEAMKGLVGTFFTSLIFGVIAAVFIRRK